MPLQPGTISPRRAVPASIPRPEYVDKPLPTRSGEPGADAEIRQAYRRMSHWLGKRGWPRQPAETPLEYAARLAPEWPDPGADLATMTRTYIAARYGGAPEAPPGGLGALLTTIRRSVNKLRYRQTHAE